jgi:hypothetical protein
MNGLLDKPQVHGKCHWVVKPCTLPGGGWSGILEITSYTSRGEVTLRYLVTRLEGGYRLEKPDGEVYDINLEWGWDQAECTCGDHTFRSRTCKHAKALHAALRKAGEA